jgi:ABC-type sugar transport system ATPase subunit
MQRVIAGIEQPESGMVTFDGDDVAQLTPSQRGIGLVFQNYALYPHFRVHGNIGFYFRLRRWSPQAIDDKVQETARVMGIGFERLLGRLPRQLSGGEKQRVALARCLSHNPRVLLLDEPFSNLDAALRLQTRGEVKKLVERFGLTTIFVTHDQTEAVAMGHRLAVMRQGRIEQTGTYHELYREPANVFVAGFFGTPPMNFFPGSWNGDFITCDISGSPLRLPLAARYHHRLAPGTPLTVGLRPEHLGLRSTPEHASLPCTVEMVEISVADAAQVVYLQHGAATFRAKVDMQWPIRHGETVWLQFPPEHMHYFADEDKRLA